MLGTDSHLLSNGLHRSGYVLTQNSSFTTGVVEQSTQDTDRRGLASTIVSQQYEDLVHIHFQRQVVYCLLPTLIHFGQVTDLHLFFLLDLGIHLFNVLILQFLLFPIDIFLHFLCLLEETLNKKEWVFLLAKLIRKDLVQIERQEHPEEHIDSHVIIGCFD